MNVLSIQSAVAYGHVGNAAALLPLNLLGHDVWPIDTVRFSNHPGHGSFRGSVTPPAEVAALVDGLRGLDLLGRADALLSGYLGDPGTADVVAAAARDIKRANPAARYLCDPVMGDAGRLFVKPEIPALMHDVLVPLADIVTPNAFELGLLTDTTPDDHASVSAAARALCARGPRLVVITGLTGADTPADVIDTLAVTPERAWRVRAPRLVRRFDGAGDCFAALLLGRLLNGDTPPRAVARAVSSLQPILEATGNARDLALIPTRAAITKPPRIYKAEPLK
ncbi:MAG: pyridoxal kinase PdxY [Acetobacteraceae bacterium]|nr:pyridoxal kinase PdxY [Acetobacteraceae bacterium]